MSKRICSTCKEFCGTERLKDYLGPYKRIPDLDLDSLGSYLHVRNVRRHVHHRDNDLHLKGHGTLPRTRHKDHPRYDHHGNLYDEHNRNDLRFPLRRDLYSSTGTF